MNITNLVRVSAATLLLALPALSLGAQQTTPAPQAKAPAHHSKLKGAAVGAVAGHALGHHGKIGAVAGAMVQHHRNKKAATK